MTPDRITCRDRRCRRVTRWEPTSTGALACTGCGTVFPCPTSAKAPACLHLDCAEARAEQSATETA
jgi:hypothetical protein